MDNSTTTDEDSVKIQEASDTHKDDEESEDKQSEGES